MPISNMMTGLPTNPSLMLDLTPFASNDTFVKFNDYAFNKTEVATSRNNRVMIDSQTIPKGVLQGVMEVVLYWDSDYTDTETWGEAVIELQVYEDGNLITPEGFMELYTKPFSYSVGSRAIVEFLPSSEYRIVIKSTWLNGKRVWVDFIRFDPVPNGSVIFGESFVSEYGDEGVIFMQAGTGFVNGDNTPFAYVDIDFPVPYEELLHMDFQVHDGAYSGWPDSYWPGSVVPTGFTGVATLDGETNWTGGLRYSWFAIGVIFPPLIES